MRYKVCECSEFEGMGNTIETDSLEIAIQAYKKMDPTKLHGIPAIKMNIHINKYDMDVNVEIVRGGQIQKDGFEIFKIPFAKEYENVLSQAEMLLSA